MQTSSGNGHGTISGLHLTFFQSAICGLRVISKSPLRSFCVGEWNSFRKTISRVKYPTGVHGWPVLKRHLVINSSSEESGPDNHTVGLGLYPLPSGLMAQNEKGACSR